MSDGVVAAGGQPARTNRVERRSPLTSIPLIYIALLGTLIVGAALMAVNGENLFSGGNIVDILTRSSLLGFIAIGQTMVILCRSLDLSVGYVAALSSLVAATTMDGDPSRIPLGVAAGLGVAALVGLFNGVVTAKLKVHAFITTLGAGLIIKGYLDTVYPGPAGEVPGAFQAFGYTRIGLVPLSAAIMLIIAVFGVIMLQRTRTGHRMFAVGGNDEVARLSGIRTDRTIILAHVFSSVMAGVAGLLLAARFGTGVGAQIYDAGYDLDSIAAVVLGGTLLLGGRGGVAGTIAGVLILGVLDTMFNQLQIDPFFRDVLRGIIIIAAVAVYARRQIDPTKSRARFGEKSASRKGSTGTSPPEPTGDSRARRAGSREEQSE
ncbi:ABC transporter permease [Garicola koreensis]|uniref:Ribose transport system permease protein n=1 Tax=Garicola koreensis TaxID=1262554 RepID=A0A7W5TX26_9MICC|nr:ABC transporter permease [Garicola koreensis]MBB3668269.1 ribose transport system permease protein [Garicola koreensis]